MKAPKNHAGGVTLAEASEQTGLTVPQLRHLIHQKKVRWMKPRKYVLLHPADVEALGLAEWQGQPFAAPAVP